VVHPVASAGGVEVEVRSEGIERKAKESVHFYFDICISRIYLVKQYHHVQVKRHTFTFIYAENDCSPGKQKMVFLIPALFWRTLI